MVAIAITRACGNSNRMLGPFQVDLKRKTTVGAVWLPAAGPEHYVR